MLTIDKSIRELLDQHNNSNNSNSNSDNDNDNDNERIATIRPSSFRFWKTYDGIRLNAERVVSDVLYEIELIKQKKNSKVTKISFVGYSLGGLISRYAIGMLNEIGFFDNVKPIIFTSFATPHVGVHFFKETPFDKAANYTGQFLFGKSGSEMFLGDSDKLLIKMADPEEKWLQGLKKFEKHIVLANIKNDRTVSFFTSYITPYSPFEEWDKVKIKYLKDLPRVRIGKVEVRPKFVDFERCQPLALENEFENQQEATSYFRKSKLIRLLMILTVTILILPIWIPLVLSSTIVVSVYSAIKIKVIKSPEIKEHWERVKGSVYGANPIDEEDAKIGQHNREQRRKLRHTESFKGDTSDFTKSAMENFMYAEERFSGKSENIVEQADEDEEDDEVKDDYHGEDNEEDEDDDDEDRDGDEDEGEENEREEEITAIESTTLLSKEVKEKIIDVNIKENDKSISEHLNKLHNQDYSKFPLFTKESLLRMDKERQFIIDNLNSIKWIKIPVYIDAWNAHDGIVARRGPRTNPKGTATILLWASILRQHLLEDQISRL